MRKRFAPLVIALLSLAAFGVLGVLTGGSTPSQQTTAAVPATTAESTAPAPAPTADAPAAVPTADAPAPAPTADAPAAVPTADAPAPAATAERVPESPQVPATVVTGYGRATPCPGRDCADCPHNIYLK